MRLWANGSNKLRDSIYLEKKRRKKSCLDLNQLSSLHKTSVRTHWILVQDRKSVLHRLLSLGFKNCFLFGQFSGLPFQIVPAVFWHISKCFTLDEGICLWGKGLRCPGGGGEEVVGVLPPICQCTHSLISANRPEEEPSPAGPREEAEDFRATDSGVMSKFHPADEDKHAWC